MADTIDNPPAFAIPATCSPAGDYLHPDSWGMSLRDYFAAHCPITFSEFVAGWNKTAQATTPETLAAFSRFRFLYADAMLAARTEATNG